MDSTTTNDSFSEVEQRALDPVNEPDRKTKRLVVLMLEQFVNVGRCDLCEDTTPMVLAGICEKT